MRTVVLVLVPFPLFFLSWFCLSPLLDVRASVVVVVVVFLPVQKGGARGGGGTTSICQGSSLLFFLSIPCSTVLHTSSSDGRISGKGEGLTTDPTSYPTSTYYLIWYFREIKSSIKSGSPLLSAFPSQLAALRARRRGMLLTTPNVAPPRSFLGQLNPISQWINLSSAFPGLGSFSFVLFCLPQEEPAAPLGTVQSRYAICTTT